MSQPIRRRESRLCWNASILPTCTDVEDCRWMISPIALCSETEILRSWMIYHCHGRLHVPPFLEFRSGFKEWPLVQWPTRPLPYNGPRRPLMKINKKIALQLPKQNFYSFKLCTVDKVHAVRPVDNNNDMPFPSQKFN